MNSYNCRSAASNGFAHKLDGICLRISIGISERHNITKCTSEERKGNTTKHMRHGLCTIKHIPIKVAGFAIHRPYTYNFIYEHKHRQRAQMVLQVCLFLLNDNRCLEALSHSAFHLALSSSSWPTNPRPLQ
jgi:hypothetical protein